MDAGQGELSRGGEPGDTGKGEVGRIEREIGHTRACLDRTVGNIQDRLSLRSLADDFTHMLSSGAGLGSRRVVRGIIDNPVPAGLVGLGIAWLLVDRAKSRGVEQGRYGEHDWLAPGAEYTPGRYGMEGGGTGEKIKEGARGVGDTLKEGAHAAGEWAGEAKDTISSAASTAKEKVSELGSRLRDSASTAGEKVSELAGRAGRTVADTYEENPLVMGGVAFVLGLIGGLAIPTTRAEDKLMGRASRNLKEKARSAGEQALHAGQEIASKAADAAKQAISDEQGGDGIGGRLAGAAKAVAGAVAEGVTERTQGFTGGQGDGSQGNRPSGQTGQQQQQGGAACFPEPD
jgi:hypothetical protein